MLTLAYILADEGRGTKFDEGDMSVVFFSVIPEPLNMKILVLGGYL